MQEENWRKHPFVFGVILLHLPQLIKILVKLSGQFNNLNSIENIRGSISKTHN